MNDLILQLHGGKGGSTTNVQSYTPTDQEIRLQKQAADYSEAVAPNALWLNNTAKNVLEDSLGTVQYDFNSANNTAQNQIAAAQQGVENLANGKLPAAYQQNMEDSIRSGVQNTMGAQLNNLANRGVLNSSVTSQAMNDISKNASDTMAQQYSNNISTLNGLYGQQSTLANSGITTAAAAQEAAQQPALNLWNASLGLNGATTSALQGVAGQGTTTSTSTTSGGSGLFGGLASTAISAFCFVGDTMITLGENIGKRIADVEIGDRVKAYNADTKLFEDVKVIDKMEGRVEDVYEITTGLGISVTTTISQPLLTTHQGWILVKDLKPGMSLLRTGIVKNINRVGKKKVYDIKVEGPNTYIANGFIAKGGEDW